MIYLEELARETAEASAGLSYDGKTELILAALRQAVESYKESLAAMTHTADMWESDFRALCKALGEEVTIDTVDSSIDAALEQVRLRDELLRDMADALLSYDPGDADNLLARYKALMKEGK